MAASSKHDSSRWKIVTAIASGQEALEFVIIALPLLMLLLALIDFGRALNFRQAMVGIAREGSNIASRGDTLVNSVSAVMAGDAPLDLTHNGEVIITAVSKINNANVITGQASSGGLARLSRIGQGVGNAATVPAAAAPMLQPGQTIYVTELFYAYQPITPIGNLLNIVLPTTLYESAYF